MRKDRSQQRFRQRIVREPLPPLPPLQRSERPALQEMSQPELITWLAQQQADLESFCTYAYEWRVRRNEHGYHTENDDRYDAWLPQGVDLAAGLAEWRVALTEGEENQSGERDEQIHLHLSSQQALPLMKLIALRLEFLASQEPTNSQNQVEYQALRSIVLQLRNGAQTQVQS